jgi:hypothetical protein
MVWLPAPRGGEESEIFPLTRVPLEMLRDPSSRVTCPVGTFFEALETEIANWAGEQELVLAVGDRVTDAPILTAVTTMDTLMGPAAA